MTLTKFHLVLAPLLLRKPLGAVPSLLLSPFANEPLLFVHRTTTCGNIAAEFLAGQEEKRPRKEATRVGGK